MAEYSLTEHPNPHTQNNLMHAGFPKQGENTHPSAHRGSKGGKPKEGSAAEERGESPAFERKEDGAY